MNRVFAVSPEGQSEPMVPIRCADEAKELQSLLANNFDLLAGEQITLLRPLRWLLIRREMPVPGPASGGNRWSVDFLFVDQDAVPTFVECKRFNDTRSRREVVGQVMEYAANGQFYWDHVTFTAYAEKTASVGEQNLVALGGHGIVRTEDGVTWHEEQTVLPKYAEYKDMATYGPHLWVAGRIYHAMGLYSYPCL